LNDGLLIEEKKNWCRRCHGGTLHPTINPNELKCNYYGWSKTEINFTNYITSKGNIDVNGLVGIVGAGQLVSTGLGN